MTPLIRRFNSWIMSSASRLLFIRYVMVGSCNTVICFSLMLFGSWIGLHYLAYTAFAYATTIIVSFILNFIFTFRVRGYIVRRLLLFLCFNLLNLCFVEFVEYGLIDWCGLKPWIAIVGGMCCFTSIGFLLNRFVVYK